MEKVKLPRKVTDTLDYYRKNEFSNIAIIQEKMAPVDGLSLNKRNLTSISFDTLMEALVNGYEVEQTPEDKVRDYFDQVRQNIVHPNGYYGNEVRSETIIHVLDLLNIKIEGVND